MEFNKIFTDQLDHCYAVMRLKNDERDFVVAASEENQPCYAYDLDNNFARTTVWETIGGTMNMVQLPNTLDFLATQKFYPGFNSSQCRIVKETFNGKDWDQTIVGDFPYVHRFDIIPTAENKYLYIGCTIANTKKDADDWSDPGRIWIGEYDDSQSKIQDLHELELKLTKNHGYKRMGGYSLITAVEGVFKLTHAKDSKAEWKIEQLTDRETSDIIDADINGDGRPEYLTIEGFHGPYLRISDDSFQTITLSDANTPFGHAIWGGKLGKREYFILGWRAGEQNLELITGEKLESQLIDRQVGPSNIVLYHKNGEHFLLSANREIDQVAIYSIEI